jgi:integrase
MAMKGFMRQRGTSWELRVYLGADPVTGKQRYSSKSVRWGKGEAQRMLNEMTVAAERGAMVRTTATVGDLLTEWIEFAAPDFSPKTEKETRGYIERNLRPALGKVPLGRLKPSDLDKYYRSLLIGVGARGGAVAPGTAKRVHGILRSALNQGVRWGWLGVNPASSTTPPRVLASDIKPPSLPELGRVLLRAAEEEPELACFLLLAAATGARRSEVVALRWSDVDFDAGQVAIARGVVSSMKGLVEKDTKTHAARRVALDIGTKEVVREHRSGWPMTLDDQAIDRLLEPDDLRLPEYRLTIKVWPGGGSVQINVFPGSFESIDFDFATREIVDQVAADALSDFIRLAGQAVGKAVALSLEGMSAGVVATYDPGSDEFSIP